MKELQVNKQLPVVTTNYEEVRVSLLSEMDKYKGIIVTEESLKDCKATQKDLASLRNKIDSYRKEVKKEMELPIKSFEGQCKDLIKLIEEVEKPIKEGITVFDDKRREERKAKAIEFINAAIEEHRLEEKYASQLTVVDKYMNLTGTIKAIKEDVEARAMSLKGQQEAEKAKVNIIKSSIENTIELLNKDIKTPLKAEDFNRYIEMGWDVKEITNQIQRSYELIKEAEKPKEEVKSEPKVVDIPVDLNPTTESQELKKTRESKYYVKIEVSDTLERMKVLSDFMKANGYNYNTLEQKKVE